MTKLELLQDYITAKLDAACCELSVDFRNSTILIRLDAMEMAKALHIRWKDSLLPAYVLEMIRRVKALKNIDDD